MPSAGLSYAVQAQDVEKNYGKGKQQISVLSGLNLTVEAGTIYGLLGPSGCGKTTLLRCIIGRLLIDNGHIKVFGSDPSPGPMIGYMPQETALYNELTIGESLSYYGRLNLMTSTDIRDRTQFMIDFLTLPDKHRRINALSGGQRRRVSFAIALLHQPSLLILDEPTVGVDPILRQRIWEHMVDIVSGRRGVYNDSWCRTTIIITTHYIDEARQANKVGLMRDGVILAEDSPDTLLSQFHCTSLEDVFLQLCYKQQQHTGENNGSELYQNYGSRDGVEGGEEGSDVHVVGERADRLRQGDEGTSQPSSKEIRHSHEPDDDETRPLLTSHSPTSQPHTSGHRVRIINETNSGTFTSADTSWRCFSWRKFVALVIKDLIKMKRNIGALIFQFLLPAIQISLMCTCIGQDPRDLSLAVCNEEPAGSDRLGQQYLWHIDNNSVTQVRVSEKAAGVEMVRQAEAWGVLHIERNFTRDLINRMKGGMTVDNDTIQGSTIHVNLDMTNKQISLTLQSKLLQAFQSFSESALSSLGLNPGLANTPVQVETPVYGELEFSFTNFIAPGIIISITYFLAVGLTALSFVTERKEGLLDRTWTTGVSAVEVMLAHFTAQLLIILVQITVLFISVFLIFKVPSEGSLVLVFVLTLLQGFTGMMYGLTISALCNDEISVTQVALGSFYPNLMLSGIIWPVESMPTFMQYISMALPQTFAAEAMRSILGRGWGVDEQLVWRGFLVTLAWLSLFFVTAVILVRLRKHS